MIGKNPSHSKTRQLLTSILTAIIIITFITPFNVFQANASDIPQPTYPENYAVTTPDTDPPLGIPSFAWSAVSGANVYHLQVDSEIGFNQPIILDITTRNLTYTPPSPWTLFSDGEWYWRVRVDDPAPVGDWSPIMHFTKSWATAQNKPDLLAPAEGEQLAFFDSPSFSWTRVIGAARYRFQIATTLIGFDTPVLTIDTLSATYQPNGRLANGIYYWRVVPMDTADHLGTPSNVQSFTTSYGRQFENMIPALISPTDESTPTFTPTFHWTAIKGAGFYRLEYTSDETCDFSVGIGLVTRQTYYTPTDTFSNDLYCWRVRVESGVAVGDWTPVWHFKKTWDLKPTLLTPTNLYQKGLYPLYSWTPVPGAARYHIQISLNPNFIPLYEEAITANTTYTPQSVYGGNNYYYWHVRPIDGGGKYGVSSNDSEFKSVTTSIAPIQIYPLYYYQPNANTEFQMSPYEDRSVAFPIFMWHRIINVNTGGIFTTAYRIQVSDSPYFGNIIWQYDTENTSASPTAEEDFNPSSDQVYYWRVCALDYMGGNCLWNPDDEWWSQAWAARFDTTLELTPTVGLKPLLLRPAIGQEAVEATPLLEWWPLEGATQYQVEVSRDEIFSSSEITETVNIPAYSPKFGLAQRTLELTDYGTFYWRVRGFTSDGWGDWSDTWRFQIASQSEWKYLRIFGDIGNRLLIGDDPSGDASQIYYDLTDINASQSVNKWYFGFNANLTTTNMTYVFYLDLDNKYESGATDPPAGRAYSVTTVPEHQPEFAIFIDVIGGVVSNLNTWVYAWNGSNWGFGQKFSEIGAQIQNFSGYVELELPYSAIGMNENTSSTSIMLFSVNLSNGLLQDSVPSDPNVPGTGLLSRFSTVSEHLNLVNPPNAAAGDPTTKPSILPFFWDWPTGSNGTTPFAGITLQVDLDQNYTPPHEAIFAINSNARYFSENNATLMYDIVGDNIYYWRIHPRYLPEGGPESYGAWTGGWRFNRFGFEPLNLTTSVTFATPTFSWDMAEGANTYRLQVATDPNFGNTVVDIQTPMTSYTPPDTLPQDSYYWRVEIIRYGGIYNDWSEVKQFDLSLPTPTGLTPDNGEVVHYTPTFCWDPLVGYDDGVPVLTAWRYLVQVSTDPNFSSILESMDTYHNCWTSIYGYDDRTYYWRVAMYDGNNRLSSYSPSATFTKQYPITTLISPISGSVPQTPTFIWTPVDGAATYIFESSWYPTFYPAYETIETVNTQYTPVGAYQTNKAYYWRVAIRDRSGKQGPFTDASIIIGEREYFFLPLIIR